MTTGNSPSNAIMKALAAKKAREEEAAAAAPASPVDAALAKLKTTYSKPQPPASPNILNRVSANALQKSIQKQTSSQAPLPEKTQEQTKSSVLSTKESTTSALLAKIKAASAANNSASNTDSNTITYNAEQLAFINLASSGNSGVLIGAAGTGKTTCTKGALTALLNSGLIPTISDTKGHKHLSKDSPGIIITSFTRRAVNNIRKVQSADLKPCCMTVHKLLEYAPDEWEIYDPETEQTKQMRGFRPMRNKDNKLPATIHTIVIEEASMLSTELFTQIIEALPSPSKVQFIFIGDIQQLPPVFGSAILGFKMLELPIIELIQVYRQALESPIIKLAHRILSGKPIPVSEFESLNAPNKLKLHPWKKKLSPDDALLVLSKFFTTAIDNDQYDPEEDMILIPYNKGCGTLELNKRIANHLARKAGALTYEIKAGFDLVYFSEGDKILYDKEDAVINSIAPNPAYCGEHVQPASIHLDYWGYNPRAAEEAGHDDYGSDNIDVDAMLSAAASDSDSVLKREASHIINIYLTDSDRHVQLKTAGDINNLLHGYALTVHKSQGSEFRKVFFCLHNSHNTMLQRELLYTGVTRAREELYCICEPDSFEKGIIKQRIKGDTLAEKAEFFKGKLDSKGGC